jgi:integrase
VLAALQLRIKDVDFDGARIVVRDGKGFRDRVTVLPAAARSPPREHLAGRRRAHDDDLARGLGRAPLLDALARTFPGADREWGWQWVFPASSHYTDRRTGVRHRHHVHETLVQRALPDAVRAAGLAERVTTHAFRPRFATPCWRAERTWGRCRNRSGTGTCGPP